MVKKFFILAMLCTLSVAEPNKTYSFKSGGTLWQIKPLLNAAVIEFDKASTLGSYQKSEAYLKLKESGCQFHVFDDTMMLVYQPSLERIRLNITSRRSFVFGVYLGKSEQSGAQKLFALWPSIDVIPKPKFYNDSKSLQQDTESTLKDAGINEEDCHTTIFVVHYKKKKIRRYEYMVFFSGIGKERPLYEEISQLLNLSKDLLKTKSVGSVELYHRELKQPELLKLMTDKSSTK